MDPSQLAGLSREEQEELRRLQAEEVSKSGRTPEEEEELRRLQEQESAPKSKADLDSYLMAVEGRTEPAPLPSTQVATADSGPQIPESALLNDYRPKGNVPDPMVENFSDFSNPGVNTYDPNSKIAGDLAKEAAIIGLSTAVPAVGLGWMGRGALRIAPEVIPALRTATGPVGDAAAWATRIGAQSGVETALRKSAGESPSFAGTFASNAGGDLAGRWLMSGLGISPREGELQGVMSGSNRVGLSAPGTAADRSAQTAALGDIYKSKDPITGQSPVDLMFSSGMDNQAARGMLFDPSIGRYRRATVPELADLVKRRVISGADRDAILSYQDKGWNDHIANIEARAVKADTGLAINYDAVDARARDLDQLFFDVNAAEGKVASGYSKGEQPSVMREPMGYAGATGPTSTVATVMTQPKGFEARPFESPGNEPVDPNRMFRKPAKLTTVDVRGSGNPGMKSVQSESQTPNLPEVSGKRVDIDDDSVLGMSHDGNTIKGITSNDLYGADSKGLNLVQQLVEANASGAFGAEKARAIVSVINDVNSHIANKGIVGDMESDLISTAMGTNPSSKFDANGILNGSIDPIEAFRFNKELSPSQAVRLKRAIDANLAKMGEFDRSNAIAVMRGSYKEVAGESTENAYRAAALKQVSENLAMHIDRLERELLPSADIMSPLATGKTIAELNANSSMMSEAGQESRRVQGVIDAGADVRSGITPTAQRGTISGAINSAEKALVKPLRTGASRVAKEYDSALGRINTVRRWEDAKNAVSEKLGVARDLLPEAYAAVGPAASSAIGWMTGSRDYRPMPGDSDVMDAAGGSGTGGGGGGGNFDDGMPPLTNEQAPLEQVMQQSAPPPAPMWRSQTPDGRLLDKNEQSMLLQDLKSRKDQGQIDEGMYYLQMNEFAPGGTMRILPEQQPQQVGKRVDPKDFMMELRDQSRARPRLSQ